ncbi:uncharacterized protein LOC141664365 [Apium graveolens]|uniref:uncharacterized protein LOC141664365 n=1 Tax=Apium graveolens TaxID=4045 RepID=UPI003D78B460
MAGLLAWAADVVRKTGASDEEQDDVALDSIPLIFTPDQQKYVRDLDQKANSLTRSIQDLRLRLPPPDISQRLPHLHAHSIASNAALALQLNAHSATKEQAQLREFALQEENEAHLQAISTCEKKIQDKLQEADFLQNKLKEMDVDENNLKAELENVQASLDAGQSSDMSDSAIEPQVIVEAKEDTEALLEKLDNKKNELGSMEQIVEKLETKWTEVQENALKQPRPAQREKILDKQLHSLIEQLASKQAQAEGLVNEIHVKEIELERLNGLCRRIDTNTAEMNAARNRYNNRVNSQKGPLYSDYIVDPYDKPPYNASGRVESLQRQMLMRSAFVLYILLLHILVFIKISF